MLARLCLNKEDYHLFRNVTLPTEDGTTQIDHIVVSRFGIFVIETKNMKGWIFGSQNQRTWTQKIYKHTNKFQNPLHQNYRHTKTLEDCLDLPDGKIFSVIVFVGDSTFKTDMPENVVYASRLNGYIKTRQEVVLTEEEVSRAILKIEGGRLIPSLKTRREHIANVGTSLEKKRNSTVCPRCGSELIVKVAQKGVNRGNEFLACSGFPRCRYTRNAA